VRYFGIPVACSSMILAASICATSGTAGAAKSRASAGVRSMTRSDCVKSGFLASGNYVRSELAISLLNRKVLSGDASPILSWWPSQCRSAKIVRERHAFAETSALLMDYPSAGDFRSAIDRCLRNRGFESLEFILKKLDDSTRGTSLNFREIATDARSQERQVQLCSNDVIELNPVVNLEIRPAIPNQQVWGRYTPELPVGPLEDR
jgi:hypothetical protein